MPRPSKIASPLVLLAAVALAASCRANDDPDAATALLEKVKADGYTTWTRAPGYETRKPSDAPHSDNVEIFVNPVVADVLASGAKITAWPDGSIIVKDGYDDDGVHALTAIMEKRSGEWFWAEFDEDDEPTYSGSPGLCRACHESGGDYVRAFGLP
jgi:hypothetical protein